jgi:tetratricopeptide (TPR) repeat protein
VAWFGAALLVAGLAWSARSYFGGRAPGATPTVIATRPAVAVLGFENLNRNADSDWLATALAEMLDAELSAGGALRVVSGETVARVRKEMGLERALALSPETLTLLRANLLAEHILTGSYITQGPRGSERLRLVLRLQSATTGETESISGEDSIDQLFRLADGVGDALRAKLGLAAATASEQAASPAVVPRDTEAARTYSEGLTHLRDRDLLVARELLEKAVRLDADNAAAHSALAEAWFLQGYDKKALAEAKKAFDRSADLTGEGRLLIEARFRALSRDWDRAINLYSSLWTMEPDDPEHIERLARTQLLATKWKDALSTLESAYAANPPLRDEPSLALIEGEVRQRLSDFPGALAAARRALATASPRGARLLVARAHHGEGQALLSLGSQAEARAAFERSRDLYREIGDREGEALSSRSLAVVLRQTGNLDEAYRIGADALRTLREMGNQRHAVTVLNTLANIRYDQSRLDDAARLYDEILAIGRETEDLRAQAAALGNLGNVYFLRGDLARAISSHREALRFKREMGDRAGTATTLISLAVPLLDHVEPAQAVAHLEEALGLAREIGSKGIEATALHVLAETRFHTGDVAAAQSLFETARTAQRELGDASRANEAALWLLLVDLDQRRFAGVREGAAEVIRASQELEAPNLEAAARAALAQADAALGLAVEARREAATARRLAENDEDLSLRWSTLAQALRAEGAVDAIEGSSERARRALQRLGDDASARGFTRHGFEIQLMVEELALADGDADASQRLEALSDRARRAGFGRVSERARDLAQRRTLPLGQAVSSPSMSRPG